MEVFITVKSMSSSKKFLAQRSIILPETVNSLRGLIEELVHQNIRALNELPESRTVISFLTASELESHLKTGKAGFDHVYGGKKADVERALEEAEQAFSDGLYRVFINDHEVGNYEEPIEFKEQDNLVFLRLTMLAGRMW
ncbi:hypothetical protein [Planococcus sp. CAU13]|uniref:hypothetical protein n=1 Tax=Planococcus sp. CAU13 TaxID=1541197 RepID=UPI00052FF3D7|nr:hypothetical protein [Planococcus sp. CAU13]